MIGTENRLFLKLVEPNASLIFAGVNSATTDPRLTIETTDVEKPNIPSISLEGIGQINNSTIIINNGNGSINNNNNELPWWLTYIIFPLLVTLIAGFLIYKFRWNK